MSGSTREQPRAPAKQQIDFFLDLFAKNDLTDTMIFTHFGLKISRKCDPKNTQKTGPSENRVFGAKVSLSEAPDVDFRRFWLPKRVSGGSSGGVLRYLFPDAVLHRCFVVFSVKNVKNQKMKKCVSIYKLHTILEVAPSEKIRCLREKTLSIQA